MLVALATGGVTLTVIGWLAMGERLPRNGFFGVRTAETMRGEDIFRVANRVAGLPIAVGGAVATATGIGQFVIPDTAASIVVAAVGVAGMAVITVTGGVHGHRIAASMPDPGVGHGACACRTRAQGACCTRETPAS